jgi:hypothetical protein
MTIVTYSHPRKRPMNKPKAGPASALAVPAVITHKRRRGRGGPQKPIEADPEAEARLVEFFKGMGLTYVPPDEG